MSRRIGKDFVKFSEFLDQYRLSVDLPSQQQAKYRAMHKKLYGLLVFIGEFNSQGRYADSVPFLTETSSDLTLTLFCVVQGMYKPAKLLLRCSIENFSKALCLIENPDIILETSLYRVFDLAKEDKHFASQYCTKQFEIIHSHYTLLCGTVHSDPVSMYPTSALSLLPQMNDTINQEVYDIFMRITESYLGILYYNYPNVIDVMHPENKKDFFDSLSKSTKKDINEALYGE